MDRSQLDDYWECAFSVSISQQYSGVLNDLKFTALVLNATSVQLQGNLSVSNSSALNVSASSLSVNGSLSLAPSATLTLSSNSSLVVTGISSPTSHPPIELISTMIFTVT